MKGMKHLLFAASCAVLAACTQTDEPEVLPVAIGFTPTVDDAQTRGEDLTTATLRSFGVFAYFTQGGDFNPAASPVPNFMHNQEVSKSGSSWTYSPTMYWPVNSNDKLSFFAYAPHGAAGLTVPGTSSPGYPSFTYEVPNTEAAQTDLLLAQPVPNKTAADGTVAFSFQHALTRIKVKVEAGEGFTDVTINSLSVQTKKTGTVAFTSTATSNFLQWSGIATGTAHDVTCEATLTSPRPTVAAGSTGEMATFFLLPVADAGNTSEKAKFSIGYTMNGAMQETKTAQVEVSSMADWLPATSITYTLKVTRTGVTVAVSSIGVWTGTAGDVDKGGEIAEGYKADDIKPGDYYYDDGTRSDGGYRVLVDGTTMQYNIPPTAGKNCIGIVYANGKTGTERGDAITNYSSTGLSSAIEIKGYVVRLESIAGRRDGDGSNSATAFNGYQNTQSLSTSVENPRQLREIIGSGDIPAAPSSTSGWYVMSLGQTMYAYEQRDILNKSRSRTPTSSGSYYGAMDFSNLWTSSYKAAGNFPTNFTNGKGGESHGSSPRNAYLSFTF